MLPIYMWGDQRGLKRTLILYFQMKAGKNKELDYLLINLCEQPQPPNWQEALEYRQRYSLRRQAWSWWGTDEYFRYGPGVTLYFALLKSLFWLFMLITVASLPALLVNYQGNGLSLYGSSLGHSLMLFSLGNQPTLSLYGEQLTVEQELAKLRDIRISQCILLVDDLLCSIIVLCFLVYWQLKSENMVAEMIKRQALPSYSTILVSLPPVSQLTVQDVRSHFQKFGAVRQVQFVYDYGDFLMEVKHFLEEVDLYSQEKNWKIKEKKYDSIEQLYFKLKHQYQSAADNRQNNAMNQAAFKAKQAFVSFQQAELANRVKGIYQYRIGSLGLDMGGRSLNVQGCHVEPLSILWENYHMPTCSQIQRSWLFGLLVSGILLVTLFGILLMSLHTDQWLQRPDLPEVDYATASNSTDPTIIKAFCAGLTYKTFQWRFHHLCAQYFGSFSQHWMFVASVSGVTVCINIFLIKIVNVLAELRRFRTVPEQKWFLIVSIFLTYLFSSSLLVLLIRGEVSIGGRDWSLVALLRELFPSTPLVELYREAGRKWYLQIGKLLMINYMLTLNLCPWLYIVEEWLLQKGRELWASRAQNQKRTKERLLDKQFYWQFYYAVLLNSVYFCLIFSVAMPLFYCLAFVSVLSLFITSKIIFHNFTRLPHVYDHKLNTFMIKAIAVSLVLHQLTSNYFFSIEEIFPENQHYILPRNARSFLYYTIAIVLIIFAIFPRRIASLVRKKTDSRKEELMITQEINSSFGAGSRVSREIKGYQQKVERRPKQKVPLVRIRKGNYLNSYKMQDNPYYNSISYTLLILHQTIIERKEPDLQRSKPKQEIELIAPASEPEIQKCHQSMNGCVTQRGEQLLQSERIMNQSI